MADFVISVGLGDIHVVDWADTGLPGQPDRLSAPKYPHRYARVGHGGLPTSVTVSAVVGGVAAPLDAALGGRLFTWWWEDKGAGAPPSVAPPAGHTSTVSPLFTPDNLGTWVLACYRDGGGCVRVPFSVELADAP
jgi:hypothetical protein